MSLLFKTSYLLSRNVKNYIRYFSTSIKSIQDLSYELKLPKSTIRDQIVKLGEKLKTDTENLNEDLISYLLIEHGYYDSHGQSTKEEQDELLQLNVKRKFKEIARPPVITIMGHVDHGKTTLLDYIRKSNVAQGEAGGITQRIGAFSVVFPTSKLKATFLDTPGHAAFTEMRQRGSLVTDMVILVVAINDGIQDQTIESIRLAKEANVPMIVAINKIDKQNTGFDKLYGELAAHGVSVEAVGGDVQSVKISAIKGLGMSELEDSICALTEVLDLKARRSGPVKGTVIESKIDKAYGAMATVLVQEGTLKLGTYLVSGTTYTKVKTMKSSNAVNLESADPSVAVEISGWDDAPPVGETVNESFDMKISKKVTDKRKQEVRMKSILANAYEYITEKFKMKNDPLIKAKKESLDKKWGRHRIVKKTDMVAVDPLGICYEKPIPTIRLVLRADVIGSLEALETLINRIPQKKVKLLIIEKAIGGDVGDTAVEYTVTCDAFLVCYNISLNKKAKELIENSTFFVHRLISSKIIYEINDRIQEEMLKLLPKNYVDVQVGRALIKKVFTITNSKKKKVKVFGCFVVEGKLCKTKEDSVRESKEQKEQKEEYSVIVKRDNNIIYEGTLDSFKHFKEEVYMIQQGSECAVSFLNFDEAVENDMIECFYKKPTKGSLA